MLILSLYHDYYHYDYGRNYTLGIAGVSFPLFIMALIPIREKLLPHFYTHKQLEILDSEEGNDNSDGDNDNDDDDEIELK